jgi:hypothetical protein
MMKKIIIYIMFLLMLSVPVKAIDEFCGCIKRVPVNEPTTVNWIHDGAGTVRKFLCWIYKKIGICKL